MSETLTETELAEIEALSAKVPDGPWFADADVADDVPDHRRSGLALVDTGRSGDWWIARLCEWHTAQFIADSKTNIDALCRSLRAAWAENAAVRDQLARVEKERDDLRKDNEKLSGAIFNSEHASAMRDKCVEKVRWFKYSDRGADIPDEDPHSDNRPDYERAMIDEALEQAARALESLTLDQEKQ